MIVSKFYVNVNPFSYMTYNIISSHNLIICYFHSNISDCLADPTSCADMTTNVIQELRDLDQRYS